MFIIALFAGSSSMFVVFTGGRPDYLRAAQHFVKTFRSGKMGQVTLDDVSSPNSDDLHNSIRRDSSSMSDSLASKLKKFP